MAHAKVNFRTKIAHAQDNRGDSAPFKLIKQNVSHKKIEKLLVGKNADEPVD